jgi:uncharacterized protein YecT (DUF1311 family)
MFKCLFRLAKSLNKLEEFMMISLIFAASLASNCVASGVGQKEMSCLAELLPKQDAELKRRYLSAIREAERDDVGLDSSKNVPTKVELIKAERAWVAYREAHCLTVSFTMRGGSGQGIAEAECRAELTEVRIEQLKSLSAG